MFIDQIRSLEGYTLKLSSVDNETGEQIDFELRICEDSDKLGSIAKNLGTESAKHPQDRIERDIPHGELHDGTGELRLPPQQQIGHHRRRHR